MQPMEKWNHSTLLKRVSIFMLILGISLVCQTAVGQDAAKGMDSGDDAFMLEEIVVTAEFREKTIQETPLSITGFSSEMLEMRNMNNLPEIAVQAPNVSLRPGNALGNVLVAFIRGIGQVDFDPSVEAGVGIYVDDVYYSTLTGNLLDLLDLERVEVLRGPQGTLAGRNAIGGAIKLFTRKADGGNDGYVSLTYGDLDRLDVKAASGFEILPGKLFARIAGVSRSRDGYVTSYDYACVNDSPPPGTPGGLPTYVTQGKSCKLGTQGGQSMTAGRLSLRWLASDSFEVNFAANIVNDKSEAQPQVLITAKANGTRVPIFFDNDGDGVYTENIDIPYDNRFAMPGTYSNYATYIDNGKNTPDPRYQGGTPGENINVYKPFVAPRINHFDSVDYSLNLNWQLAENVSLYSVTSYREYDNIFSNDLTSAPLSVQLTVQGIDHEQFTQELRLNATLFDAFADLTLGGFYLDQESAHYGRISGNNSGFDFLHGPDKVPAESKAVYGQLNLNLTDRMSLSLGMRYSADEKSYTFQRHNPDGTDIEKAPVFYGFPDAPANSFAYGLNGLSIAYSSDRFDYRVALDYDLTEDIMVYGQVATGYRGGGNNARPFNEFQLHAFDPEQLINYEVGMKSTLFNQLRLNASVFFNDYSDIQLTLTNCYFSPEGYQFPCSSLDNVGDAEVKGFELEGVWQPTRDFMVDFSYSVLDFEFTKLTEGSAIDINSNTPYTPEAKWSLGAQYSVKLGNSLGRLTPRLDASFQDEVISGYFKTPYSTIDSYTLVNGRLTWQSEDANWEISLEVTNLTDEYYILTLWDYWDKGGFVSGQPGRPMEWAFTIKRSWF